MPAHASPLASDSRDTALVLVNLGTPDAPTAPAVRRYLAEFLHDRRVVDLPRWLWWPLLHGAILPLRAPMVAKKYASIWLPEPDGGSPLAVYTRRLAAAVQRELPELRVLWAMRYGTPSLARTLTTLREQGVRRILALPLYPQYSTSTTASVGDVLGTVEDRDSRLRTQSPESTASDSGSGATIPHSPFPIPRLITDYHLEPDWLDAVAASIRRHRDAHGAGEHLLFSFHGLPQRFADRGDPYPSQCEASARAIAQRLALGEADWSLSYQSRFGRERWLEPATDATLDALAGRGLRRVDVVAPGFAVDCIETLEEVAMMLAERFAEHGGALRYIPCLNDDAAHAQALAAIALRALRDWR